MMYFAWMKQIIKRIFRSLYLYIAIFFFISYISVYKISGVTDAEYTTINTKKYKDNIKWIYNLDKKTTETVLPTKSFEDLIVNTVVKYSVQTVTLVTIAVVIPIAFVLTQCYLYGREYFFPQRIEPDAAIPDVMPIRRIG